MPASSASSASLKTVVLEESFFNPFSSISRIANRREPKPVATPIITVHHVVVEISKGCPLRLRVQEEVDREHFQYLR